MSTVELYKRILMAPEVSTSPCQTTNSILHHRLGWSIGKRATWMPMVLTDGVVETCALTAGSLLGRATIGIPVRALDDNEIVLKRVKHAGDVIVAGTVYISRVSPGCQPATELTYIVSGGALNSTHSPQDVNVSHSKSLCRRVYSDLYA